jgi:Leucine-rich repeat (LRR) protein
MKRVCAAFTVITAVLLMCSCKEINAPTPACTKCDAVTAFSDAAVNDGVHAALNVPAECSICSVFIPRVTNLAITKNANLLDDISKLPSLRVLIIDNNTLASFPAGLTTLPISSLSFGGSVLGDWSGVTALPSLTALQFTGCTIINPTSLSDASKLSRLVVSGCTIGSPQAVTSLVWLAQMSWLNYIDVSGDGLQDINSAATFTDAATFIAAHNLITTITALSYLPNLHYVDLSYNNISDISPLYTNSQGYGLVGGDYVNLKGNPLDANSKNVIIPELQAQNITVLY